MSVTRHHAEWLSLVEVSGPFLSLPVLLRIFPQGLDDHDPDHFKDLRLAYEEWEENSRNRAIHNAWVHFVLKQTLGLVESDENLLIEGQTVPSALSVRVPEHGETLRPDLVIISPADRGGADKPRCLIQVLSPDQDPNKSIAGKRWKDSPATRMMILLRETGVSLGLITNGEQWMLVYSPRGETTGYASWYAHLWLEEKITLQAFRSLLSLRRFFGVDEKDTIEALLAESASNQQEVTDQLGYQVRAAVELLVGALDNIDKDQGRKLLSGIDEKTLYEAALTVMMRLVFLFSAEERGLLLLGDPLYDQHYAVSTLRDQLQREADQKGEEILQRRYDAYSRLLAIFRAVHGGVRHDLMHLRAYGGTLFDPDRYPFLEGRQAGTSWRTTPALPLPVDNRIVLHLLEALQVLLVRVPGGGAAEARRLSFRALDIEQIGHVYEGLLDHTAKTADEPILGLTGTKDKEPEIPLSRLESLRKKGDYGLIDFLHEETGRSKSALKKDLENRLGFDVGKLLGACDNNQKLLDRVKPFTALLRIDSFGRPVVITKDSVYVTAGTDRRTSGTHYTPRSLTEPIVRHTLDPLVYEGPVQGKPAEEWKLKSARDILALRVCDFAMGSGAFLVQACRYLSAKLVEAWDEIEANHQGRTLVTPEGDFAEGDVAERIIPKDDEERIALARRLIVERCLYGVDKNPMAVEMAKLSLWLITLSKDRPFTFVDHALRCGDSLVGVNFEQLSYFDFKGKSAQKSIFSFSDKARKALETAIALRRKIETIPDISIKDIEEKQRLLRESEELMSILKLGGDLLIASYFGAEKSRDRDSLRVKLMSQYSLALTAWEEIEWGSGTSTQSVPGKKEKAWQVIDELKEEAEHLLKDQRPFHWALEFPEIFLHSGADDERHAFDALNSNPPFQGGKKITGSLGSTYRGFLVERIANNVKGNADLCAYFFLRAANLIRITASFGMLATNTISQGETREVGLDQLLSRDFCVIRAIPSRKWPGTANLEVAHIWMFHGQWRGSYFLNDATCKEITSFLAETGSIVGKPYKLSASQNICFQGAIIHGDGFTLTPEEAAMLLKKNARNKEVVYPYLSGDDLTSRPDQSPSRWVINFHDWPLEEARKFKDCIDLVIKRVKPGRDQLADGDQSARDYAKRWWQFGRMSKNLNAAIVGKKRVLFHSHTSKYLAFGFAATNNVFAGPHHVVVTERYSHFSVLQSTFHESWARKYSSTHETRLRYTPSGCFETFPFPILNNQLVLCSSNVFTVSF